MFMVELPFGISSKLPSNGHRCTHTLLHMACMNWSKGRCKELSTGTGSCKENHAYNANYFPDSDNQFQIFGHEDQYFSFSQYCHTKALIMTNSSYQTNVIFSISVLKFLYLFDLFYSVKEPKALPFASTSSPSISLLIERTMSSCLQWSDKG